MEEQQSNRPQKKKLKTVIVSIVMALAIILSFVGGYFSRYIFDPAYINTTTDLMRIINKFGYVIDPETGEQRSLTEEDYADALVSGLLDQYSEYYTPEEYQAIKAEGKGRYTGVGINIMRGAEIVKVAGNSPAFHSGLRAGDVLLAGKVEGQTEFTEFTFDAYHNGAIDFMVDCPSDKLIFFKVKRNGEVLSQPISLLKGAFKASYVTYYDSERMMHFTFNVNIPNINEVEEERIADLNPDVALIRLDRFEGSVATELGMAINYAVSNGRTKIILDLRNNGGGYMDVLTDVASYLIYNGGKAKNLIAISKGKNDSDEYYSTKNKYNTAIQKIAVIANDNTASASECLIGAMLTYGTISYETLVVEKNYQGVAKTYGKGIMQTTYLLVGGGAFKLTTARVLWPNDKGTCIQGVGIIAQGDNAVEKGHAAVLRAQATIEG